MDQSQGMLRRLRYILLLQLLLQSIPPTKCQVSRLFYNTGAVSTFQNQDVYGATMHLTGYFSQNGAQYNLGFVNSSSDRYTLAVLMNVDPGFAGSTARVIWEANRHDPVGFNATIGEEDGDLVLRDADGRFVWNTGTANRNVTEITIQDTGNLVVLSNQSILWQSFDHPSDTLMVGQIFQPGMKLQSRKSSRDSSPGDHTLVMEPGGLVLYSNLSGLQEPYWIYGYYGMDTLDAVRRSCGFLVTAALHGQGLELLLDMELSNFTASPNFTSLELCRSIKETKTKVLKRSNQLQNQTFLRLEYDGNLRAYTMESTQFWGTTYEEFNETTSCSLPAKCQPFGLCSNGACTVCLSSDGSTTPWNDTCSAPAVDSCTDLESLDFLRVPGMEYFSSRYLDHSAIAFEDCRAQCLRNCSCSAFYYWEESSACFMTNKVETLQAVSNQSHVAYIKATRTSQKTSSSSGLSTGGVVGITSAGVAAAAVFLSLLVFAIKRRRSSIQAAVNYDSDNFLESLENLRPMRFTHGDLERITDNFSRILGVGGFGGVYEGVLPDGRRVAVKKLESTGQGKKEFYAEVAVLGTLHHWNLVKLLGFCSEGLNRLLVYEHMPNGSLDRWIFEGENSLSWNQRMEVMVGMARGLAYLHEECMEKIIHLDIKPQNILLDESFVAKVADFGLSRLVGRDQSFVMTTMRGTPGYLAPEWLLEAAITEKSDVYSFGVVVLEVVCGRKNFSRETKFHLPAYALELTREGREMELLDQRLMRGSAAELDESAVRKCIRIAFQCLQEDASARPSMGNVVQMLEGSIEVKEVPSENLMFSSNRRNSQRGSLESSVFSSVTSATFSGSTFADNASSNTTSSSAESILLRGR